MGKRAAVTIEYGTMDRSCHTKIYRDDDDEPPEDRMLLKISQNEELGPTKGSIFIVCVLLSFVIPAMVWKNAGLLSPSASLLFASSRPNIRMRTSTDDALGENQMKRSILLLRHAKSSWKDYDPASTDDFDRPLNLRGKQAAKRLGRYLQNHAVVIPDQIYASPSARTQSTLHYVQQSWAWNVPVQFDPLLYDLAMNVNDDDDEDEYRSFLRRRLDPRDRRVLVVGHNPAIGAFANRLLGSTKANSTDPRSVVIPEFPPGTFCEIQWNVKDDSSTENNERDWSQILTTPGELVYFITPDVTLQDERKEKTPY